jgi:hypothetical protein
VGCRESPTRRREFKTGDILRQVKTDAITAAIHEYFRGERQEMYAILAFSVGLVLVAGLLHAAARDGFSRAFGIASLVLAVLLSSTAVSLLVRDPPHEARLAAAAQGGEARTALAAEEHRMAEVIRKYPLYRITAMVLGLVALIAVATLRRSAVVGVAAGLLVLVVAQWTIDHYSEERARRYHALLEEALTQTTTGLR